MEERLQQLEREIAELRAWRQLREQQQISYPLDDASRNTIGAVSGAGPGSSTLTQTINTAGATASVPAAYAGSIIIAVEGGQYEIPYLS